MTALTALAALAAWLALGLPCPAADDAVRVSAFLERLRLPELHILHLERQTTRAGNGVARAAAARQLADLYCGQLLVEQDPRKVEDFNRRVEELLRRFPEVRGPRLQTMLLQSQYTRAAALAEEALVDGDDRARGRARDSLAPLAPELTRLQNQLHQEAARLAEQVNDLPEGPLRSDRERQLAQAANIAGRASFFAGWSWYYLGLLKADRAGEHFAAARASFRKMLGQDKPPDKDDLESFELDSPVRARLVLGLGLSELACGEADAGLAWLNLLRHERTVPQVRDEAGYWVVRALGEAGRAAEARTYAEREVASYGDAPTPGRVRLCLHVAQAGLGSRPPDRELGLLGVRGLLRMKQLGHLRRLLARYPLDGELGQGFLGLWLHGQGLFDRAEQSRAAADFQAAAAALAAALAAPDAAGEPLLAAECRHSLGWCRFQLGELDRAAADFRQAAQDLRKAGSTAAPTAAWNLALTCLKLADKDPAARAAATDALERFKKDFPGHPNAARTDLLLARLGQDVSALEKVPADAPNYPEARLELVSRHARQWRKDRADPVQGRAAAAALRAAAQKYLALPERSTAPAGRLECLLVLAELDLQQTPPALVPAGDLLRQAGPLAAGLDPADPAARKYHYQRLLWAQGAGDDAAAGAEALWLSQHARETPYEEPALVARARQVEAAYQQAAPERRPQAAAEALPVFRRLAVLAGDAPDKLKSNKNAQVASSRLAVYALECGQPAEAARQLDRLLAAFPREVKYLQRAGRAHFLAGNYPRSLECWRLLAAGLPADADDWFEARCCLIKCLAHTDPPRAQEALRQFRLLHPTLGPPAWRAEFEQLVATLKP